MAGVPAPSAGWNMKPVRRPRRREPLLPPSLAADRRWYKRKRWALALALATLVVIRLVVAAAAHRRQPPFPYCRKSALVAVLDATEGGGGDGRGGSGGGGNGHGDSASQHLIVWAGQGLHKAIRPDLAAFDLRSNRWLGPLHPPGELGVDVPVPRWKAGNAQAAAGGMVVVGGDAYWPGTLRHEYGLFDDIWRLEYPSLRWSKATPRLQDSDMPKPLARRGHSTAMYTGEDGLERIVVFGGRTRDKHPLNDCWEVTLSWPNATWRMITPEGIPSAPEVRRGHSALMVGDASRPMMLVYGGREEMLYHGSHLWLLDIRAGRWQRIEPQGGRVPPKRDHHAVALHGGRMYVFAGRSGKDYCHATPLADLWALDLETWRWERLHTNGSRPLHRFEESYAQWGSRLLVFGGQAEAKQQTKRVCQLNDLWQLDLGTLEWAELSAPRFCTRACQRRHGRGGRGTGYRGC